ncbi:MAG: alkaline phosphatase family protein [Fidelibacterota bacterium]|nr:MAG: alkaline phosphatase family protein [Candidatus Neomarinimicrobiota bacterium]
MNRNILQRLAWYPVCLGLTVALFTGCGDSSRLPPTLILISLDGFRWDYFEKAETPNLDRLADTGVKARGLIPAFPSKTFPNHYSIITGLYPENHGIVSNTMFDPVTNDTFLIHDQSAVSNGRWYGGEPLWATAEKQGQVSATLFWVGSEAEISGTRPTYWHEYDHDMPHAERVNQVLTWLDLPPDRRPTLICMYLPDIDDGGHQGTSSPALITALQKVDSTLGMLFDGLIQRGIMEEINIIVLSDHGMVDTDSTRVIILDEYVDLDQAGVIDWTPVLGLWPPNELRDQIYRALKNAHPQLQIYLREEIPDRFHYSTHHRIPPIVGIADEGWSIASKAYFERNPSYFNAGSHGYDNRLSSMRGIFIARGPAFRDGLEIAPFQNIHLYALVSKVLNLEPATSDGQLDSLKRILR